MEKEEMIHSYNKKTYSHNEEWTNTIYSNTELEIIILSEVSQKDKYHMISITCGSKIWHKQIYLWNRNRLTNTENTCGCQEGRGWGRGELGVWD